MNKNTRDDRQPDTRSSSDSSSPARTEPAFTPPTLRKRGALPKVTTAFGGTFTP